MQARRFFEFIGVMLKGLASGLLALVRMLISHLMKLPAATRSRLAVGAAAVLAIGVAGHLIVRQIEKSRRHVVDALVSIAEIKQQVQRAPSDKVDASNTGPRLASIDARLKRLEDLQRASARQSVNVGGSRADALCELGPDRVVTLPEPSAAATPAPLRALPFPFTRYLSIASDADSMTIDMAERIAKFLADDVRLNLSDSTFIDTWLSKANGDRAPSPKSGASMSPIDGGAAGLHAFLRLYHSGYVDTVHGWGNPQFLMSTEPQLTFAPFGASSSQARETRLTSRHGPLSPHSTDAPNELVFWYTMPLGGALSIELLDAAGATIWSASPKLPARIKPGPATVHVAKLPPGALVNQPRARVTFTRAAGNGTARVDHLALTSSLRASVEAMASELDRFNVRLPIFTHHSFPPIGDFGLENLLIPSRATWGAQFAGDNPESPAYWLKSLEDLGLEFILPANRTAQDQAFPIKQLTYPFLFNDLVHRYGFHRIYTHVPGFTGAIASHEAALGAQIRAALAAGDSGESGSGSVLYTHWGVPLSQAEFDKIGGVWPLSRPSIEALREMSARYHGVRDSVRVPARERLWVAPLHRTLIYATMRRQIEAHVRVDDSQNVVFVRHWNDPINGRVTPDCRQPSKQLHGLTVYVPNSQAARVVVGNQMIWSFTRNTADETGRESITIIDDSTPTLIFDEVDLYQMQGKVVPKSARYFLNRAIGLRTKRSIEIVAGPADGAVRGEVTWQPAALNAARSDAFQFSYRKNDPSSRIGVVLELATGETLEVYEEGLERRTASIRHALPAQNGTDWTTATIDFAHLDHSVAKRPFAATGKIAAVRFLVDGQSGTSVFFDRVAILRQNALPDPPDGFIVGGKIDTTDLPQQPHRVVMELKGGKVVETVSDAEGHYYFPEKVKRGDIVLVYAEGGPNRDKFFPEAGRLHQIERNTVDLDIIMRKSAVPLEVPGLQKEEKGVSAMVPGVGRIYKPHSEYVTTGLSTPPEFRMTHAINNLGYIDRERRAENPSGALRVLLMGVCTTFGHTEEVYHHAATILEALLEHRSGRDVEVINLSSALQQAGFSHFYYEALLKAYKIDVVAIETIGPLEVGMTKPEFASMYFMHADKHLPQAIYREDASGELKKQPADPTFMLHPLTDPAKKAQRDLDMKTNAYVIDGVDFLYLFHRDPAGRYSDKDRSVFPFYEKLLKRVRADFERDGVRVVFVVNDLFGASGTALEFMGNAISRRHFDKRMREYCDKVGAPCVLFTEHMLKRYPEHLQRHWRRDTHYNRVGYRWYSEVLSDYLIASNFAQNDGARLFPQMD